MDLKTFVKKYFIHDVSSMIIAHREPFRYDDDLDEIEIILFLIQVFCKIVSKLHLVYSL